MARNLIDDLNRSMPVASDLQLGTLLQNLITSHNALLTKLDADAGVTDVNYSSLLKQPDLITLGLTAN